MIERRSFLTMLGFAWWGIKPRLTYASAQDLVMTVQGAIPSEQMGTSLIHEHVLVDFIGADRVNSNRYDVDEAFRVILPYLRQIRELECQTLVECTPAYIGRDPILLQRLSEASGLHILTNTGYYGAANDQFIPRHAYDETADQLASRWLKEWTDGIDNTGIRPGFIKIGVDSGILSEIDSKLVYAAAITSKQSGLAIASHTGDTQAALAQMDILQNMDVDLSSFIWVHSQNDWQTDPQTNWLEDERVKAAKKGVWISIDNVASDNTDFILEKLLAFKRESVLHRVLLSHDAGWYSPGEPNGGNFRPFTTLFTMLIPALKNAGFSQEVLHQILVMNPRNAFTLRKQSFVK